MNTSETTVSQVIDRPKEFPPDALVRVLGEDTSGGVTNCFYEECNLLLSFYRWESGGKTYVDIGNT